ncbi:hypothetical protein GCM10022280_18410 [Sphingomonas swuensis]|uniref:Uncharacterized protein n=1 Tax=Sphingomonas swuensis TaxID=977800 RepID=A0ABP7T0F7_9SPHN
MAASSPPHKALNQPKVARRGLNFELRLPYGYAARCELLDQALQVRRKGLKVLDELKELDGKRGAGLKGAADGL